MSEHIDEVARGERFEFGKNWARFLKHVDEKRIRLAEASLIDKLEMPNLEGKSFLDIGSGSGLFSLAARRLGARVHSIDYDGASVACTRHLKERFFPSDAGWTIEEASVLNGNYIAALGQFDIVYSWGVLHHTGDMWSALGNVVGASRPGGKLFISLYNDQGIWSRRWLRIKRVYNRLPPALKLPYVVVVMLIREIPRFIWNTIRLQPRRYIREWTNYAEHSVRGMSRWHDQIDWVGGYPFEVAKPEEVFDFLKKRGFRLDRLKTNAGGLGCNEYVFTRCV
jgi:2-polyprenyl-6-hydroxyphenyl methylase/3-demethylubiquinone-9 3-methyltransferase